MPEDHIKVRLGLPEVRIVGQEQGQGGELRVVVRRTTEQETCPGCGHQTRKCHDVRERVKLDEPLGDRSVLVVVVRRRFRCVRCCRVFTEPDQVAGTRRRLTRRFRERLGRECRHQTTKRIAEVHAISPTTVRRALAEVVATQEVRREETPLRTLGIDEFSLRKGRHYATGLHDLTGRRVLEVIAGRTQEKVQTALERLRNAEQIAVVSMDMAGAFRAAVQTVLPEAVIVADKFHVIKRVGKAVWQLWRRLLHGKPKDDPLRQDGALALRAYERLSPAERSKLDLLLHTYPLLHRAHRLKEDFRHWYRRCSASDARLELGAWRRMIADLPELPEFQTLAGMFALWQEEILNYFTYRVTQGFVEGKNNLAKAFERRAFGYRNVDNLSRHLRLAP
jgi:transposase